jgi:AraC-like DNA-binding protein
MNQFIGTIGLVTASQALFMGALLCFSGRLLRFSNQLLLGLALVLAIYFTTFFLAQFWPQLDAQVYLLANVQLLLGPLLYLYVLASIDPKRGARLIDAAHFLPALIFALVCAKLLAQANSGGALYSNPLPLKFEITLYGLGWSAHLLVYCLLAGTAVRRAGDVESGNGQWLQRMVWLFALLALARGGLDIVIYFFNSSAAWRQLAMLLPALVFLFLVSRQVFGAAKSTEELPSTEEAEKAEEEQGVSGYRLSAMDDQQAQDVLALLDQAVVVEQRYLINELKLGDLAAELEISTERISEALNGFASIGFYDYLAKHRTAHAADLLADRRSRSTALVDIAMASGFNSKSTFNRQFKQRMGVTPSQYRKERCG